MNRLTRRSLLGGLSLLPVAAPAGAQAGVFLRLLGRPASLPVSGGSLASISPGAGWTGVAKSGGIPAVFAGNSSTDPITRTTAKPAIHWLVPSDLRLVGSRVYGVDADAKGGLSGVVFHCEGNEVTVAAPSFYSDTDANGASRTRWGYWISVVSAATSGEARLFATAVPTDGTMQSRVIGYDTVSNLDGNYPMSVFPRAVANDWSKTVAASGADYTTLMAAIDAAAAAIVGGVEAPLITITQTGFYEATNTTRTQGAGWPVAKNFCTVTPAGGVTATIGRAAAFTPSNEASWPWTLGVEGVEFRGAGIVFDQKNWTTMAFTTKAAWLNGCKITNSVGTRDSLAWNGGVRPVSGPAVRSYWDGVSIEYMEGMMQGARYAQDCNVRQVFNDIFSGNHYVVRNYVRDFSAEYFRQNAVTMTFHYTNPGGHTTATVSKTVADAGGGSLLLKVDGATVATIPLGYYSTDTNPTVQDVVNAVNAFASGWSATAPAGHQAQMRATYVGYAGTFTDQNAFGVDYSPSVGIDIHADWWQGYSSSSNRENVIIRNNVCRDAVNVNSALFNDDAVNGGYSLDHIVKGNVWDGVLTGTLGSYGSSSVGFAKMSHYVFENNTHIPDVTRNEVSGADTIYCSFKNNLIGGVDTAPSFNMAQTQDTPWVNNFYWLTRSSTPMDGGYNPGNVQYGTAATYASSPPGGDSNFGVFTDFHALMIDPANGDYRPKSGGTLLSNLKPRVNTYDGSGVAYSASDVVGARSLNAAAPTYPF